MIHSPRIDAASRKAGFEAIPGIIAFFKASSVIFFSFLSMVMCPDLFKFTLNTEFKYFNYDLSIVDWLNGATVHRYNIFLLLELHFGIDLYSFRLIFHFKDESTDLWES